MNDTQPATGRCLCGKATLTASSMSRHVGACHCSQCRKWTGGPFLAVECGTGVTLEGESNIAVFRSSEWAERGFCNECGTHLFYRLIDSQQYFVPAGLFDNSEQLLLDHQVFIDEKPAFYAFANKTRNMTGAEAFLLFESRSEAGPCPGT